jgi:hypothetical protein
MRTHSRPGPARRTAARICRALCLVFVAAALATGAVHGQTPVPIINLHHNTSSGVPAAPYAIGTAVTVRGVLTVGVGTFTSDYVDCYIQDGTAGINVYKAGVPPYAFQIGDSVTINGTIAQYRGMTEITLATYTVHESGIHCPAPLVVTCADVEHAFLPDYSEPNEGRLVQLNGVTWVGTWPSFSGPVTLQDETGTCTMYIDGTTGVQGVTPPGGEFDVIGIIKQFAGYSPPYTNSYEFMPRTPADVIPAPGPQVLDGPRETNIQANQVTIHFETGTQTTASVAYGETAAYELGTATDGGSSTVHDIVLPGLDAATVYHYRITAVDNVGTTTGSDRLFSSGSAAGCTGVIEAVFNKSVDHTLATFEEAIGGQDLTGWLIDRINATQSTIDVAIYSFNLPTVADALIAAKNRGVTIRFVYDNHNPYQAEVIRLQSAGIWVIDDSFGANTGDGIMHDKLWIFDAYAADPAQPWVYGGSWNLSQEGTYSDAQNLIMIQDQALAHVCRLEFNEMWGSDTWLPNADLSRFGSLKTDNTPKLFNIGGHAVELYFAPSDPWLPAIVHQVEAAEAAAYFCIMSFTRYDLSNALLERWLGVPGFEVRGVFDSSESGNINSEYHSMIGGGDYPWSPPADVWLDAETGTLHHKYMIIDPQLPEADPVVVTGSANWSTAAMDANDENVMIVHDPVLANVYLQEFAERYHHAGGTDPLQASAVPGDAPAAWVPARIGPNPFLGELRADFALDAPGRVTCELFGIDGRLIERLVDRDYAAGKHEIRWIESRGETPLPAGMYFLRLQTPREQTTRRVALVR